MLAEKYLEDKKNFISAGNYLLKVVKLEDAKNAVELSVLEAKISITKEIDFEAKTWVDGKHVCWFDIHKDLLNELSELKKKLNLE